MFCSELRRLIRMTSTEYYSNIEHSSGCPVYFYFLNVFKLTTRWRHYTFFHACKNTSLTKYLLQNKIHKTFIFMLCSSSYYKNMITFLRVFIFFTSLKLTSNKREVRTLMISFNALNDVLFQAVKSICCNQIIGPKSVVKCKMHALVFLWA